MTFINLNSKLYLYILLFIDNMGYIMFTECMSNDCINNYLKQNVYYNTYFINKQSEISCDITKHTITIGNNKYTGKKLVYDFFIPFILYDYINNKFYRYMSILFALSFRYASMFEIICLSLIFFITYIIINFKRFKNILNTPYIHITKVD